MFYPYNHIRITIVDILSTGSVVIIVSAEIFRQNFHRHISIPIIALRIKLQLSRTQLSLKGRDINSSIAMDAGYSSLQCIQILPSSCACQKVSK